MSELQQACEAAGITITSVHVGLDVKWDVPMDRWATTIHYQGRTALFDFWCGIGHRRVASGWKAEGQNRWHNRYTGDAVRGVEEGVRRGVLLLPKEGPSVADVLSCLLSDAEACSMSFEEWADNFGANSDSITALNNYRAGQANGDKLMKLLGRALIDELRTKEH